VFVTGLLLVRANLVTETFRFGRAAIRSALSRGAAATPA
jgi:hypothetical protein